MVLALSEPPPGNCDEARHERLLSARWRHFCGSDTEIEGRNSCYRCYLVVCSNTYFKTFVTVS